MGHGHSPMIVACLNKSRKVRSFTLAFRTSPLHPGPHFSVSTILTDEKDSHESRPFRQSRYFIICVVIMRQNIQSILLKLYSGTVRAGLLSTSWGRSVFFKTYTGYKSLVEAGDIRYLRRHVKPGEVVIDIGANVGYFTNHFARWVSDGGFIIAMEPETSNFR